MKKIILSLLLIYSSISFAKNIDLFTETFPLTSYQVNNLYDEHNLVDIKSLPDLIDKEEKISRCINEYILKQSKTYSKIAQDNLYNLINNFDNILSKIYGKKPRQDGISYQDKIEALATVQCEAYYTMGVLK